MVDFKFSEEEELFRESVIEFAKRYIEPKWIEIDEKGKIPLDLIKKMGEQGLFCIPCSDKYGGMDGTYLMTAIAVEEIARHEPAVALAVYTLLNNGWPYALELFGTEEAKQEILPRVARGEAFYGIASTEPHGGSDVAGTKTRAEKKNGKWVLNGEKIYISGVQEVQDLPYGGGFFTIARTGSVEEGHRALTAFNVLPKWEGKIRPGFEPTIFDDVGRHGLSTGGFKLTDFEVEEKHVLGEVNKGFYLIMQGFNLARILVSAACVGSARWALEQAVNYFREKKIFGRYLSSFQGVNFRFAELYAELEMVRLMVYKAAWLADKIYKEKDPAYKPKDLNIPVAIVKLKAPELATRIYTEVLKWYGAYGYTKEAQIYRGWLGTFSYTIGAEGAQNIMRYIIARDVIGTEYVKA